MQPASISLRRLLAIPATVTGLLFVAGAVTFVALQEPADASRALAARALSLAQGVGDSALALEEAAASADLQAMHDARGRLTAAVSASTHLALPDVAPAAAGSDAAILQPRAVELQRALLQRGNEMLALAETQRQSAARVSLAMFAVALVLALLVLRYALRMHGQTTETSPPALAGDSLCLGLFSGTRDSVCLADAEGTITRVNDAFERASGYSWREALGQQLDFDLVAQRGEDPLREVVSALRVDGRWSGSLRKRRRSGELAIEDTTRLLLRDNDGAITGMLSLARPPAVHAASEDELRLHDWQNNHDVLTKLPNRALFVERLGTALHRRGDSERGAVLMLDLDRFKGVNDTLGHGAGDELLIQAANRLALNIRDTDNIARLDGDHFGIVVTPLRRDGDIERVVQTLLRCIEAPFTIEGRELYLSACVGVAMFPDDGGDAFGLIQKADHALHEAKRDGRNAYRFFEPQMNVVAARRLELETDLRRAIEGQELSLVYQPVMDIHEQRVVCVEALLRWKHPRLGPVSPAEFVPIAEDSGLIVQIGRWVVESVHQQILAWRRAGLDGFRVAVNLSSRQIGTAAQRREFSELIRACSPESLTIECTERLMMDDAAAVASFLDDLRSAGARIALDDFGTGYSSLAYVSRFPLDVLKIDKSFVDHMEGESADFALVATIISMGRTLGLEVIAEGVETKDQLEHLKLLGCHLVQGYYYCRPVVADELVRYLSDGRQLAIAV